MSGTRMNLKVERQMDTNGTWLTVKTGRVSVDANQLAINGGIQLPGTYRLELCTAAMLMKQL